MAELPMNTIIIMVLAVIVLTAVSVFLVNQVFSFNKEISDISGTPAGGSGSSTGRGGGTGNGLPGEGGTDPTFSGPVQETDIGEVTEEGEDVSLIERIRQSFVLEGDEEIHHVQAEEGSSDSQVILTTFSNSETLTINKGESGQADLQGDGVEDVEITYKGQNDTTKKFNVNMKALANRTEPSTPTTEINELGDNLPIYYDGNYMSDHAGPRQPDATWQMLGEEAWFKGFDEGTGCVYTKKKIYDRATLLVNGMREEDIGSIFKHYFDEYKGTADDSGANGAMPEDLEPFPVFPESGSEPDPKTENVGGWYHTTVGTLYVSTDPIYVWSPDQGRISSVTKTGQSTERMITGQFVPDWLTYVSVKTYIERWQKEGIYGWYDIPPYSYGYSAETKTLYTVPPDCPCYNVFQINALKAEQGITFGTELEPCVYLQIKDGPPVNATMGEGHPEGTPIYEVQSYTKMNSSYC